MLLIGFYYVLLIVIANTIGYSFERYCNYQNFSENLKESNRKPSKIWVDKGGDFYNRSIKSLLEKKVIEMYSTHN